MSRIQGLSYGNDSIAYRKHPVSHAVRLCNAQRQMGIAREIYTDEWNAMSPLIRPAAPYITPYRAFTDGFITEDEWLTLGSD